MQLFNSTKDYGAIPQALHWLTVFLVALAWALGTFDDVLPKGGPREFRPVRPHLRRDSHPLPSRSAPNLAVGRSGSATGSHRIW